MEGLFMLNSRFLAFVVAAAATVVWTVGAVPVRAQNKGPVALTGQVSSQEDGPMEGVLVTAKKTGSTIATTVVSDVRGRYRFPASRLEPGQYAIRLKAAGYELEGPPAAPATPTIVPVKAPSVNVDVAGQKTTTFDIKLRKANRN